MPNVFDAETTFGANVDGLYMVHEQAITSDLLDTLKSERLAKAACRSGELDRVASVPTVVIEIWQRQGFDFYNASAKEIVARLNAHDLGAFIATPKRI